MLKPIYLYLTLLSCIYSFSVHLVFSEDPNTSKKNICLNMIVKNESQVIKRCLKSVIPLIDYWVIFDTGSTDGTQQIIRDYMAENHIPGELHERPWVNFGHNRQEALEVAKKKGDYILFIDADDVLTYTDEFKLPELIYDVYLVKGVVRKVQFHLWLLVKADHNWQWRDPIHEHLHSETAETGAILDNIRYHYISDGARSKDSKTVEKDIALLKEAIEQNPHNTRMLYHLAQTYNNGGEFEKALPYYQKRVELGGDEQEVFWAILNIGKIQEALNYPPEEVEKSFLKAHAFRPSRPEPIYYLAIMARLQGKYEKGFNLSKKGIDLPESSDILHLELDTYDGILLEHAFCALELGKIKECITICDRFLKKSDTNTQFYEAAIKTKKSASEKIRVNKTLTILDKLYSNP